MGMKNENGSSSGQSAVLICSILQCLPWKQNEMRKYTSRGELQHTNLEKLGGLLCHPRPRKGHPKNQLTDRRNPNSSISDFPFNDHCFVEPYNFSPSVPTSTTWSIPSYSGKSKSYFFAISGLTNLFGHRSAIALCPSPSALPLNASSKSSPLALKFKQ